MSITLKNFKKTIDPTVLGRGREYFKEHQITDLEEVGDGAWSAQVQGTEVYSVEIRQDEAGTLDWNCDCPYDFGPLCKHVAAVLYAIEENFSEYFGKKPRKASPKRKTQAEQLEEILQSLSREDLIDLVKKQAAIDRQLAASILARYGGTGDNKKAYLKLVKAALNAEKDHGYIDYQGSNRAARKILPLIEEANLYLEKTDHQSALPIFQAVIEAVVPAISQADDSNGQLGDCISWSFEGLTSIAESMRGKVREEFFKYCLMESPKELYSGWDWGWEFANLAAKLLSTSEERSLLFQVLDTMAIAQHSSYDSDGWFSHYQRQRAEMIKLSVIERLDSPKEAEAYLKAHLDLEDFRQHLILLYIEQGKFSEAKALVREFLGSERSKKYRGLESRFYDLLLQIALKENDKNEIMRLAESLFLNSSDFKYYEILKKTVASNTWLDYHQKLLNKMKQGYRSLNNPIPEMYVREEMWQDLLAYFQDNLDRYSLEQYRLSLEKHFPKETSVLYEKLAYQLVQNKTTRKGYQETCAYLRRMQKLGETARVKILITELRAKYSKRSALLDELDKL
jgi:hypothetical protein